jgi:diguanylate cyclase (GGDEF)-like protein
MQPPHPICSLCEQGFLSFHGLADAIVAVPYFAIPITLAAIVATRRDLPFKPLFVLFGVFIVALGTTHVLAVWRPNAALEGVMKALTFGLSLWTAAALLYVVPKALALRSPRQLEQRNLSLESAGAEIQAMIEHLGEGVVVYDDVLSVVRANPSAQRLLSLQAAYGDRAVDSDGVDVPRVELPLAAAKATGETRSMLLGFGPGTARRWVAVTATPIRLPGSDKTFDRIVMSLRDVTDLKSREQQQRDYAHQLHSLHLIATMTTTQRKQQIEAALLIGLEPLGLERAFLGAIDLTTNDLVIECSIAVPGSRVAEFAVGTRHPLQTALLGRAMQHRDVLSVLDVRAERDRVGYDYYAGIGCYIAVPIYVDDVAYGSIGFIGSTARATPFSRENVEFVKLAGDLIASAILRDAQTERLDNLAFFDALTGLPNRVLLYDRLVQMINASERRGERFAVLYIDLDGFKHVNDEFGHAAGDAVLKSVAARLNQDVIRESDTVARLGGDEFIIIAAGVWSQADAESFAERVLLTLRQPIGDGVRTHQLGASIGVSLFPRDGTDMNTLIEQADVALYEAKHSGKNHVRFASRASSLPDPIAESGCDPVGKRDPATKISGFPDKA